MGDRCCDDFGRGWTGCTGNSSGTSIPGTSPDSVNCSFERGTPERFDQRAGFLSTSSGDPGIASTIPNSIIASRTSVAS